MGQDKASLELDGLPLAVRVVDAVAQAGADEVICVGGDSSALSDRGLQVVADDWPGAGPLGALLTAMRVLEDAGHDTVFVASCDLVRPDPSAVATTLAVLAEDGTAQLAVPVDQQRLPQWLHAAWRVGVAPALATQFEAGERSLHRAVRSAGLRVAEIDSVDPAVLADANTPEELPGAS